MEDVLCKNYWIISIIHFNFLMNGPAVHCTKAWRTSHSIPKLLTFKEVIEGGDPNQSFHTSIPSSSTKLQMIKVWIWRQVPLLWLHPPDFGDFRVWIFLSPSAYRYAGNAKLCHSSKGWISFLKEKMHRPRDLMLNWQNIIFTVLEFFGKLTFWIFQMLNSE